MEFQVLVEPSFSGTYWCGQYLLGIRDEIARMGGALTEVSEADALSLDPDGAALIVVGSLKDWMSQTAARLRERNLRAVLAAPPPLPGAFSAISMDYAAAIRHLCRYFAGAGRARTALIGVHPNSLADLTKRDAFLTLFPADHVFPSSGDVARCCREFIARLDGFDSAICSNGIVALKLLRLLAESGVAVPDRLFLASIGETALASLASPGITTLSLDCLAVGRSAVRLCALLKKSADIAALSALIEGRLTVRESTAFRPDAPGEPPAPPPSAPEPAPDFYADESVRELFLAENLASNLTDADRQILAGLFRGEKYGDLAESLYVGESTVKYRVRRMLSLCGQTDRAAMLALLSRCASPERLTGGNE